VSHNPYIIDTNPVATNTSVWNNTSSVNRVGISMFGKRSQEKWLLIYAEDFNLPSAYQVTNHTLAFDFKARAKYIYSNL